MLAPDAQSGQGCLPSSIMDLSVTRSALVILPQLLRVW